MSSPPGAHGPAQPERGTPGAAGGGQAPQPQACYRHPDRGTYIRCARCGKPICPDCMVQAPVGFQCPECVARGKVATAPRTTFGGHIEERPRATLGLIAVNVVMFGLTVLTKGGFLSGAGSSSLVRDFGVQPAAIADGEWWRLLTAMFLHGGVMHLFLNMFALYILGSELERLLGWWRFLGVYLVAGLAGAVASYWMLPVGGLSVGASGAIFGIVGAFFVAYRRMNYQARQIALLAFVLLLPGFVFSNIDMAAHVGGLVGGAAAMVPMAYAPVGPRRTLYQAAGLALVALLVAGLAMARTAALTP